MVDVQAYVSADVITIDDLIVDETVFSPTTDAEVLVNYEEVCVETTVVDVQAILADPVELEVMAQNLQPIVNVTIQPPDGPIIIIEEPPVRTTVVPAEEVTNTANGTISIYDAVSYLNGGLVRSMVNDLDYKNRFQGLAMSDGVAGDVIAVKVSGVVTNPAWSWDVTKEIFLDNNGALTQTPDPTSEFVQQVATVLTEDTILILPQEPNIW